MNFCEEGLGETQSEFRGDRRFTITEWCRGRPTLYAAIHCPQSRTTGPAELPADIPLAPKLATFMSGARNLKLEAKTRAHGAIFLCGPNVDRYSVVVRIKKM